MKISTRIARTLAVASLAVSGTVALAPAVSATVHGPSGEIANPTCPTHGDCGGGGGGGGFDGPGDFKNPQVDPTDDPKPEGPSVDQPVDQPVIVTQPTFTG
jgi:hypothetical protein